MFLFVNIRVILSRTFFSKSFFFNDYEQVCIYLCMCDFYLLIHFHFFEKGRRKKRKEKNNLNGLIQLITSKALWLFSCGAVTFSRSGSVALKRRFDANKIQNFWWFRGASLMSNPNFYFFINLFISLYILWCNISILNTNFRFYKHVRKKRKKKYQWVKMHFFKFSFFSFWVKRKKS